MQKKMIVIATAAALSLPVMALADTVNVAVYGVVNLSADYISTGDATAGTKGVSKLVVSSNQSRIGFKGAEDLGDGLSAIWQIESLVAMDNAGGVLGGARNTFAGLKSNNLGTVLLGRHDTPYQMTTRKLDVFMDGLADSRGLMGGGAAAPANTASRVAFDGRQPDSIVYLSPTWDGLNVAVSRVNLKEDRVAQVTTAAGDTGSITSLAGMYTAGPIYASFAHERHNFTYSADGRTTKESATKLGFGFTQDAFLVNAVVEKSSDDIGAGGANSMGHTSIYLAAKFNAGNGAIKAAIAKAGKLGGVANTDARQISLGYDHNLSKRSIAYFQYTSVSNGDNINYSLASNSSGGATSVNKGTVAVPTFGADPSAMSFGVRHMF